LTGFNLRCKPSDKKSEGLRTCELKIGWALSARPLFISACAFHGALSMRVLHNVTPIKKPMRAFDPHRQYAFSQSAGRNG